MQKCAVLLIATMAVPLSAARAQQFAPDIRVDSVFVAYDVADAPGCAVGVHHNGHLVYARGYGLADLEHRVPLTPASVFDIASTSKQFTAATILLLAQEGKLALDDDVRRFIPELPVYERPITLRHLLNHTSGLRDYIDLLTMAGIHIDDVATIEDALEMIVRQRALNFAPGEEHLYSNSGYFLLSIVVERVTGRSLRDEARDRIFLPLGMAHTSYLSSYDDIIPDRAIGYEPRDSGYRADMPRWLQLGDGGVFTTVTDLVVWGEGLWNSRLGGTALRDSLVTPGRLTDGTALDYALGVVLGEHRGLPTVFHGGSWGGYRAEFLRFPEQQYGVAVLCNRADANPQQLARQVAEVHLAREMDPLPTREVAAGEVTAAAVSLRPLQTYLGTYRSESVGPPITVVADNDELKLVEPESFDLLAISEKELEVVGTPVRLVFEIGDHDNSAAPQLTVHVPGFEPDVYRRVVPVPITSELAEGFVGKYHSTELGATLQISRADSLLSVEMPGAPPQPLQSVGEDQFVVAGLNLHFSRGPGGVVTGMLLDQQRTRGIAFDRMKAGS